MKKQNQFLTLLLLLGICLGAGAAQAAMAGAVTAWGDNQYGQSTVPATAQSAVIAIAAGQSHTVALKDDGSVVVWDWYGVPVPAGLSGVTAIAAGGGSGHAHSVAIYTPASPAITSQPMGQSVSAWQSASLTVTTVGYPVS